MKTDEAGTDGFFRTPILKKSMKTISMWKKAKSSCSTKGDDVILVTKAKKEISIKRHRYNAKCYKA